MMKKQLYLILFVNLLIGQFTQNTLSKTIPDSLIDNKKFQSISKKYDNTLGRDNDPKLLTDASKATIMIRKLTWTLLTSPGLRFLTRLLYPDSTVSYFNVKGAVALTIDDGFCGIDNKEGCLLNEVRELLNSYNAHATFFTVGSHCKHVSIDDVNMLIENGNEIANHNMLDWPYNNYSTEDFEYDLLLTKTILTNYKQVYSNWYRAPFGKLSDKMQAIINKHNLIHVLPDAFAHDSYIPDPKWIAKFILKKVKPGSIILIHMPEKGVREWNLKALELTLKGLKEKQLTILNLSEMQRLENNFNSNIN